MPVAPDDKIYKLLENVDVAVIEPIPLLKIALQSGSLKYQSKFIWHNIIVEKIVWIGKCTKTSFLTNIEF